MSKPLPTVLVDTDEVLADFKSAYLELVHEYMDRFGKHGARFNREQITEYRIEDSPFFLELKKDWPMLPVWVNEQITRREGFCWGIKPFAGARESLDELQKIAHVYIVTSPWHESKTWMHERVAWLDHHMGMPHKRIVQTNDKSVVHGHFMIDDKPENLLTWTHGMGLLWDQAHNRGPNAASLTRVLNWSHAMGYIKSHWGNS